jgi:hypothetical protein
VATDIPGLDWNKITSGKPTTLTGYGITDAVAISGNQTITGIKTFSNDLIVNGLTLGRGKNAVSSNSAGGYQALYNNTTGNSNTANGSGALFANTTGSQNTANGASALVSNTTGNYNTAIGANTLLLNTTGNENTAIGANTLKANTTGISNTAVGVGALQLNTKGGNNTANGRYALGMNTEGYNNLAIGSYALWSNITGSENTAIGISADVGSENLNNATAIGYDAKVNASNKVRIGNTYVTVIEGQVNWSVGSDIRLKDNVEYSDKLGLGFINELKTATFTYKNDSEKRHHDGLIAQDVRETLNMLGLKFSGIIESENDEKILNLSYAEFVIPLINSVKELSSKNQEQEKQIENQQKRIDKLEALVNNLSSGLIVQDKK